MCAPAGHELIGRFPRDFVPQPHHRLLLGLCLVAMLLAPAAGQAPPPGTPSARSLFGDEERKQIVPGPSEFATDQPVIDVVIEGNRSVPTNRITAQMGTRIGRPYDPKMVQRDVRLLAGLPYFVSVHPFPQQTSEGWIVTLRVVERPTIKYVEYLGNKKVRNSKLAKETGLQVGGAVDPFAVEEGRRKIEELYQSKGFSRVQVEIVEGNKPQDQGVVYVINEGGKQKVWGVKFEGNEFASDGQLETKIESKPGWLWPAFPGKFIRETLDEDTNKLISYYRSYGFFQAKVGRIPEYDPDSNWVTIKFVIHEGPRYNVRNVTFQGNTKFASDSIAMGIELPGGKPFEQAVMNGDTEWIKQLYGSQGYVFADIRAEPVFLEEPGQLDLVYHIEEGKRWRVGRIFVNINGENPHTRIQTVLNRLSITPGEIVDTREFLASERRLRASSLFLSDPQRGVMPKITYRIPELSDTEFTADSGGGSPNFRGQSPDQTPQVRQLAAGQYEVHRPTMENVADTADPNDEYVDIYLEDAPGVNNAAPTAPINSVYSALPVPPVDAPAPTVLDRIQRAFFGDAPAPPSDPFLATAAEAAALQPEPQRYTTHYPPAASGTGWQSAPYPQPAPQQQPVQQQFVQQQPVQQQPVQQSVYGGLPVGAAGPGEGSAPVQPVQFAEPLPVPPATAYPQAPPAAYGTPYNQPAPQMIPAPMPNAGSAQMPPSAELFPGPQFGSNGVYNEDAVDVIVDVEETQTGRFMVGVGVNSNAGVVGQIVLDERNFDRRRPPTSFQEVLDGTAWRGNGEGFRLEAAPGTQVQRYLASWQNPYFLDTPTSLSLSGSYFDRIYEDWNETRVGGRVGWGYQWTENDVSGSLTYRGEQVEIRNIDQSLPGAPQELLDTEGYNAVHGFGIRVANDTRDNPFLATEGHLLDLTVEQVVGSFTYPRATIDAHKYFLLRERPDHSGRHVLTLRSMLGVTGSNTPVYDNFFAGGFSTLRGFDFRGASPVKGNATIGGQFMWINTVEYMFPLTADDMIHGVTFVDFGTVEENVTINDFRVAPGVGLRITIPAMGPAPIALDFAWPVQDADFDDNQVFTFNIGFMR